MNKVILSIENSGSASISIKGRTGFKIPSNATGGNAVKVTLPDSPQTSKLINRLRREYPILKISMTKEKAEAPAAPADPAPAAPAAPAAAPKEVKEDPKAKAKPSNASEG